MIRLGKDVLAILGLFIAGTTQAASIYFGEDLNPGATVPVGGNAETARNSFLSGLSADVQTEDFESFSVGESGPLALSFDGGSSGSIGATISGVGEVDDPCCGRFSTSGTKL